MDHHNSSGESADQKNSEALSSLGGYILSMISQKLSYLIDVNCF